MSAVKTPLVAFPDGKTLDGEAFAEALRINGDSKMDFMRREGVAWNTIYLWLNSRPGGEKSVTPRPPHREKIQRYINQANSRAGK